MHIHNGILLCHQKEWNDVICINMDGRRDYHTKWSKLERERQISYEIIYVWIPKCETYLWNRNRNRDGSLGLAEANNYIENG